MFHATSGEVAERNRVPRRTAKGGALWRRDYFGPAPSPADGNGLAAIYTEPAPDEVREAQAFMIEQEPGTIVEPHFHYVDQFQLITAGEGFVGRHTVRQFSVHFAGAATGYGPITPGPEGLSYLTLRGSADCTGAQFLPAALHKLPRGPKRNVIVNDIAATLPGAETRPAKSKLESYVSEPGGLGIALLRLAAASSGTTTLPCKGAGQSIVVLTGKVRCRGADYGPLSVIFLPADQEPLELCADVNGSELVILQYPRR